MENILGCFVSGPATYHDSKPEDDQFADERGRQFRNFLWANDGLGEKIKALKYKSYGEDLVLILFQFYLNPIPFELQHLKEIESFRKNEKSIGIPIIINEENFFTKTKIERSEYVKNTILEKLNLIYAIVKRNKLDTNLDKLMEDLHQLLNN